MVKRLKPYLLPRVPIAINDKVKHGETAVLVAKLVEEGTDNGAGHTAEGHNIDNTIKTMFSIFHSTSHT
jgi:hypothetical protein